MSRPTSQLALQFVPGEVQRGRIEQGAGGIGNFIKPGKQQDQLSCANADGRAPARLAAPQAQGKNAGGGAVWPNFAESSGSVLLTAEKQRAQRLRCEARIGSCIMSVSWLVKDCAYSTFRFHGGDTPSDETGC